MFKSFFPTRSTSPVAVGEEEKRIKADFLLPIFIVTFIFMLVSIIVSLTSKEFILLAGFFISAMALLICFELLRNHFVSVAAILFTIQGYVLLSISLLFEQSNYLVTILFILFYLLVAGLSFTPRTFTWLFAFSTLLIIGLITQIVPPIFSTPQIPGWYHSWFSLLGAVGLVGLVGYLSSRSIIQALDMAIQANKFREDEAQEKRKFESIISSIPHLIFMTDLDGAIVYVNPTFSEVMGYSEDEVLGKNPRLFKSEFTPSEFYENLWETLKAGQKWVGEFVNRRKDDTIIYVGAEIVPLVDNNSTVTHYVAFEEDITLRKELAYEISEMDKELKEKSEQITLLNDQMLDQSRHDPLTGLYNRSYLNEMLSREILRTDRARNHLFILLVDIDHFQEINEKYGYSTGDTVLKSVAQCMQASIGKFDQAFRYGNDEFILLVSGKSADVGLNQAEQLRNTIETQVIEVDQQQISITVSLGMVIYPIQGKSVGELLQKAEKALDKSKQADGNQVILWSE